MSKVLVLGGAGFIGSHVAKMLSASGHQTTILDKVAISEAAKRRSDWRLANLGPRIDFVAGDIANTSFLQDQISAFRPDAIVHLAAPSLVEFANRNPMDAAHTIIQGTQTVLEVLRMTRPEARLIVASSSMVYGNFIGTSVDETHPTTPTNLYGTFKLATELISRAYAKTFGLDIVIVRPTAVYGPLDGNNRVIEKWIKLAMSNQTVIIDGDGSLTSDFTFVEDCAAGLIAATFHSAARGDTFNLARGQARSLSTLVAILREHFPYLRVEYREKPDHIPVRGTLNVQKARTILGFEPIVNLEEGIRRYVAHLQTHEF
jgi:nucleoside-diphosphate-sugar epimerase